ncbi:site-specific DNA-methyltransferase [Candidatus Woesearchaeota archaeon]|nr:site-specific DNA-methyltransferase [Candidatus Woesearchaeota archaeon]
MQKRIQDIIDMGGKSEFELVGGKKVKVDRGQFWIQKQRQGHSLHYVVPYQACFAPQIPKFFIEAYSKKGDIVFDPFCGRGTTVFEANQLDRIGQGIDISPLALQIARAKLKKVTLKQVKDRLKKIDFSKKILDGYKGFKHIYHPKTYSQLMNLQKQLKNSAVDNLIRAIILGRLHGHSKAFFSVWTFNVISLSKERIKAQSKKRGTKPEFRNVVPRIILKAETILRDNVKEQKGSGVYERNISKGLKLKKKVDLIVTSPPFLNVINYIDDNWLRFWFLGYDREKLRKVLVQTDNMDEYSAFIKKSMKEMYKLLKKGKYCIIEVGDVKHKGKKVYLDNLVVELADEVGFKVEKILINYMTAPKISKAFSRKTKYQGTKTNRCVVMRKV